VTIVRTNRLAARKGSISKGRGILFGYLPAPTSVAQDIAGESGTPRALIEASDHSLYAAKRNGRDRVECSSVLTFLDVPLTTVQFVKLCWVRSTTPSIVEKATDSNPRPLPCHGSATSTVPWNGVPHLPKECDLRRKDRLTSCKQHCLIGCRPYCLPGTRRFDRRCHVLFTKAICDRGFKEASCGFSRTHRHQSEPNES